MKHYFEYCLFWLLTGALGLLSIERSANLCSFIARKIGPFLNVSKIARRNLQNIYGDEIDIDSVIDDLWDNFGRYIGEFPFINKMSKAELDRRIKFTGMHHIEHLQSAQQPFMLLLCHQANWDVIIRKINDIYPQFGIVYRKANNPLVDRDLLLERSKDENVLMIPKGPSGARGLVRAIKSKMSIAMLVDQKMNDGIEVPFFGKPAMTAPAMARFALQYDYPIIPCQLVRIQRSSQFEIRIHPAMEIKPTGDKAQDCYNIMKDINLMIEKWIREYPGQWFWFHNRWK